MTKYPFIKNKKMYAAVMCACKMIRESGWFNKAINYAANRFDVDVDELAAEIRKRQSAGQRIKNKMKPPREKVKYKYYIVCYRKAGWNDEDTIERIVKSTSKYNACRQIEDFFDKNYGIYQERDIYCDFEYKTLKDARERNNNYEWSGRYYSSAT